MNSHAAPRRSQSWMVDAVAAGLVALTVAAYAVPTPSWTKVPEPAVPAQSVPSVGGAVLLDGPGEQPVVVIQTCRTDAARVVA